MGRCVIVAYKPKPGKDAELRKAVEKHLAVLRAEQLATDRQPFVMRAAEGTILEVFEWRSAEAVQAAHTNPAVLALWGEFSEACDYVPLTSLAEAHQMFAEFDSLVP